MKAIVFLALVAVARAGVVAHYGFGVAEGGSSSQTRAQDLAGNYNFGYDEQHTSGGSFRRENGDAFGNKVGSYGLRDADGRVRVVSYVADGAGFRASISTNEPGTAPSTPAAAGYNAPAVAPVAAVATAPVAAYAAAPVAHYAAAPVHAAHVYGAAVGGPVAYGAYGAHGAYGLGYGAHVKHFF
ncbi:cuticle protein 14-like [Ornithodoros turicata]|uniref:cuticle protein 14-like n=1 Tax=Ornithodoros turicata TaxID=34597 RepID=UPI003138BA33